MKKLSNLIEGELLTKIVWSIRDQTLEVSNQKKIWAIRNKITDLVRVKIENPTKNKTIFFMK